MASQINDPLNANAPVDRKNAGESLGLVSYITELVRNSRNARDIQYKDLWDAYERTYLGKWSDSDKTRDGERSRLIAPALAQAVDSTAASIEDALFSRESWFDIPDDVSDQQKEDMAIVRKNLLEDYDLAGVPESIAKAILNGCIYGTGIGKINVVRKEVKRVRNEGGNNRVNTEVRPLVTLDAIPPWEYVIDSQARDQKSAMFEAHETNVPRTQVWNKIKRGIYRKVNVQGFNTSKEPFPAGRPSVEPTRKQGEHDGSVWVTEYYGLVPVHLVRGLIDGGVPRDRIKGNGMVEVIATVANESELLRVMLNPFLMEDRPMVAYQHDVVPGKFWGRGVCAKGWNAQRGLDAELRARMDALGLLTSPMMGADITRMPRNPDMRVRPGKVWLTRGRPSEVLEPIVIGNLDPNTFNQSSEMERLVQVGTGAIESNAPLNTDRRNETASGISMIQSSALKRMRRTMWNLERQFLKPLVRKSVWRMMQFNPQRYPKDYDFNVKGGMGVVAREFEQSNLTALLSVISPDHPAYGTVLKGVIELSNTPKRDELLAAIDKANQPDPEQQKMQQAMQQAQIEQALAEAAKVKAEVEELKSQIRLNDAKTQHTLVMADLEDDKVEIQAANTAVAKGKLDQAMQQNQVARERNEIEKIKAQKQTNSSNDSK